MVAAQSRKTALSVGLHDRGLIAPGYKADVNVIDYDRLHLHPPKVHYDLPVGGRRLLQQVDGYDATIVSGVVTRRDGRATGARPGKLVRGAQGSHRSSARRRADLHPSHPERTLKRVSKDRATQKGLMVRDGANAPPSP